MFGQSQYTTTTVNTYVPGLNLAVTVPDDAVVVVRSTGGIQTKASVVGGFSIVTLGLYLDGSSVSAAWRRLTAVNSSAEAGITHWSIDQTVAIAPGTHTFRLAAYHAASGSPALLSGTDGSYLQGTLTVTILKQ